MTHALSPHQSEVAFSSYYSWTRHVDARQQQGVLTGQCLQTRSMETMYSRLWCPIVLEGVNFPFRGKLSLFFLRNFKIFQFQDNLLNTAKLGYFVFADTSFSEKKIQVLYMII